MDHGPKPFGTIKMLLMLLQKYLPRRVNKWLGIDPSLCFLKCDTHGCPHIEFHHKIVAEQVGKPCPLCRASLMTQEQFDGFVPGGADDH